MSVVEMAKKYYPTLWDERRIEQLVKAGRLSEAEANEIIETEQENPLLQEKR